MTLRTGYTTGSCATAAAMAAAMGLFKQTIPDEVEINTPVGIKLKLAIIDKRLSGGQVSCAVQKDAGDDPDVTNGCMIYVQAEENTNDKIEIEGGNGVGRITRPGLQVKVGHAAINPVPQRMIEHAVREVSNSKGVKIIISVPDGQRLAKQTCNPRLGIIGGISIIGTTGIVRPMSDETFRASLVCGLDVARGMGHRDVVLVPGNLGERSVLRFIKIHEEQVIQTSNFIGYMLQEAKKRDFKTIILAGHPGKLAKLLKGDFYTHSAVSGPAHDIIIDIIKHLPLPPYILNSFTETSTVEGIMRTLDMYNMLYIMNEIAERIEIKVQTFLQVQHEVGVILFNMKGTIAGISCGALRWMNGMSTRSSS